MAPTDQNLLVCPECGASNRDEETACFRCGHRLGTTWSESAIEDRDRSASAKSVVLAKPPGAAGPISAPRPTFRISSLMLVIVLAAVCAGVGHEQPVLGIALAVAVVPALAYTFVVASRSAARGRPMGVFVKVWSFIAAFGGVMVIAFSALVAFFLVCTPVAVVAGGANPGDGGYIFTVAISGTAAVAAAAYTTYRLLTRQRRRGGETIDALNTVAMIACVPAVGAALYMTYFLISRIRRSAQRGAKP